MSSLAAARADNFYIHPEWRPEYGGISKFAGSKGANQYQKYGIIRFELPFDGWCKKCERHISKGTRFNAKKDKAGKYFSTQIWQFTMKCASCDNELIIKTDPQNNTYDFAEGIRKMEQDYEVTDSDNVITTLSDEARDLIANDPIYRLQHEKEDLEKAKSTKEQILDLLDHFEATRKNDYDANAKLRQANRKYRKRSRELKAEGESRGLMISLVEPTESDTIEALDAMKRSKLKKSRSRNTIFDINERKQMTTIQTSSIFSKDKKINQSMKKKSSILSSSAREHQILQSALQKQAERNINVKKFALLPPPIQSDCLVPNNIKKKAINEESSCVSQPSPSSSLALLGGYNSE